MDSKALAGADENRGKEKKIKFIQDEVYIKKLLQEKNFVCTKMMVYII